MTFPGARQFGTSLLASAGVVGFWVAGTAAQPGFGNLIAGLQLALAQPIRIDDVLIVEEEWGSVEAITGTYVVLAIWDQRRLIIPLRWFIARRSQVGTTHQQAIGIVDERSAQRHWRRGSRRSRARRTDSAPVRCWRRPRAAARPPRPRRAGAASSVRPTE